MRDMKQDVRVAILALPPSGGWVSFHVWDEADGRAIDAAIRSAGYQRRFVVAEQCSAGNGHDAVRLVPQHQAPVRVCHGGRNLGKGRRRRRQKRCEMLLQIYAFRTRVSSPTDAAKVGAMLDSYRHKYRGRP